MPGHASLHDLVEASGTDNVFAETLGRRACRQRRPAQRDGAENSRNSNGFGSHEDLLNTPSDPGLVRPRYQWNGGQGSRIQFPPDS
jgi:hypothetical protein